MRSLALFSLFFSRASAAKERRKDRKTERKRRKRPFFLSFLPSFFSVGRSVGRRSAGLLPKADAFNGLPPSFSLFLPLFSSPRMEVGRTDGWMDGWMDAAVLPSFLPSFPSPGATTLTGERKREGERERVKGGGKAKAEEVRCKDLLS